MAAKVLTTHGGVELTTHGGESLTTYGALLKNAGNRSFVYNTGGTGGGGC